MSMHEDFEFDDDDDEFIVPTTEQMDHASAKVEKLEAVAQKLGLYMVGHRLAAAPNGDGTVSMVVIADFMPGDVAWSDRILNPEEHSFEDEFREIERGVDEAAFEQYKADLAKQFEEGDDDADGD